MTPLPFPRLTQPAFGVDRDEIKALAGDWRRSARVLANLDVGDLEGTPGNAQCMTAVRSAADAAKCAGLGIAGRLDVLGQILGQFEAAAVDDDAAAGRALASLADR
ncbi:hypothetical protein GOARA_068_01010 [Gordonia araii NBRC 100433]|uniref:Uncharacterized protein n=1 Tax=Gordonia araii NBRC 100433 TaxID=1073574 RepID=G7H6G5_9ACTN|nr:hypothetical protein [Gordonia araii]NNG96120.1 hypothetical protein [Gordonia araii NBRC 100433]GAB11440.1 hypothetical protein GOARA_068_01010 [Gordonia araii NBRC 100433]